MTPSCSPFSSMTRISRARMRSLVRIKDLAERLSIGGISRLHSELSDSLCVVFGLDAPYVKGCAGTKSITLHAIIQMRSARVKDITCDAQGSILLDWLLWSWTPH